MARITLSLPVALALTACTGGTTDFGEPQPTTPTASFDIQVPDVNPDRPIDPCQDGDGDRFGPGCTFGDDCDDTNADVNPSQVETPYDGIDNDCNPSTRDDDVDKDGFCTMGTDPACPATDCDDSAKLVNPDRPELCNNSVDDDCNEATPDVQEYGTAVCPYELTATSCAAVLLAHPDQQDVDGYYQLTSTSAWCDMTTDGGGYTLVMSITDDGVDSFSYDQAALFGADNTVVGSLAAPSADYRAKAFNSLRFEDLLFVHRPSGVWAAYNAVGDATKSLGAFIEGVSAVDTFVCDDSAVAPYPAAGFTMTAGTLAAGVGADGWELCSTDLYFNRGDHDDAGTCAVPTGAGDHGAYGPVWNAALAGSCATAPFHDAALAGGGPDIANRTVESGAMGWGDVTGANLGQDPGANQLWILVR